MNAGQPGARELVDGEFVTVLLEGVQTITVLAIPRAAPATSRSPRDGSSGKPARQGLNTSTEAGGK
jgi:hypothetical protein